MASILRASCLFLLFCLFPGLLPESAAQCCSPGNPVAGSASVGTVPVKTLRSITYYRLSHSDTYFEGSERSDFQGTVSGYQYLGEIISYGILDRLTAEAELGLYITKFQDSEVLGEFRTSGFSNLNLSAKYAVLKTAGGFELTAGAGAKLPLSRKGHLDEYGLPYPVEIESSTGAFGFVGQLFLYKGFEALQFRVILLNRFETNGRNPDGYRFGDALYSSLFLSKTFLRHWSATLQFRNEFRLSDQQDDIKILTTGGDIFNFSPALSYTFKPKLTLSVMADFPICRDYKGIQLGPKYAVGISVVKDFCF